MLRPQWRVPGASGKSKEATWMKWREPQVGGAGRGGQRCTGGQSGWGVMGLREVEPHKTM